MSSEVPNLKATTPRVGRLSGAIIGAAAGLALWLALSTAPTGTRDVDVAGAQAVLDTILTAPSTATYVKGQTLYKHDAKRVVYVEVDSQNSFGAVVRGRYLVAFEHKGDSVSWNRSLAVRADSNPDAESAALLATLNWSSP